MQNTAKSSIIVIKDGWCICPVCRRGKLIKITKNTRVENLPTYCKLCHHETILNIECASANEPEPIN